MFKKTICGLLSAAVATFTFSASIASAGGLPPVPTLNISATTATEIFVGESVSFSFTYTCTYPWQNGTLQPFDDTANRGNQVALDTPLVPASVSAQGVNPYSDTGTFTLTFAAAGSYNIDARVNAPLIQANSSAVQGLPIQSCDISNATAKVVVVVRDRPVTTTTIAPTTTTKDKEVLPQTGSNNTGALVAIGVALAGTAVLISRRRLMTK